MTELLRDEAPAAGREGPNGSAVLPEVERASCRLELGLMPGGGPGSWYFRGYAVFHCLNALADLGLLDRLREGEELEIARLAGERCFDSAVLAAVARYLFGLRILDRCGDGRYRLAVEIPDESLGMVRLLFAYDPVFHNLARVIRGELVYGAALGRSPVLDIEATAMICKGISYDPVVEVLEGLGARRVLDLGCGAAEMLIRWCDRNPEVQGYGIDVSPEVVEFARARVAGQALDDRIRIATGDLRSLGFLRNGFLPHGDRRQLDAIVAMAVLHEFTGESLEPLAEILRQLHGELAGVPLVLFEGLEQSDEELRRSASSVLEHHLFHRLSRQGIASRQEWERTFARASYSVLEARPVATGGIIFVLS